MEYFSFIRSPSESNLRYRGEESLSREILHLGGDQAKSHEKYNTQETLHLNENER